MRSLTSFLCACAASQAYAASPEALVYTFPDTSQGRSKTPTVSPNDARLLFAQRLGLSEYHRIGDAKEDTLELLNTHGGQQRPLFSDAPQDSPRRLLIVIEGVEHPEDIFGPGTQAPAFKIREPPPPVENGHLIENLVDQDEIRREELGYAIPAFRLCNGGGWSSQIDMFMSALNSKEHGNAICAVHITPDVVRQNLEGKINGVGYTESIEDLKHAISRMARLDKDFTSTIVLMPPSDPYEKRAVNPYEISNIPAHSHISPRAQPQTEEPLSALTLPDTASSSPHPSPPETLSAETSTSPVRGILPVCHSSKKTAIFTTHNCSGHGVPYLKYQTRDSNDSTLLIDCWACNCRNTVTKDSEGRERTVFWSGPACQKKDVSFAFWLLAGLGIGLAATISWGIGLMYSIGTEPLPSVIGAGVAGPRAHK